MGIMSLFTSVASHFRWNAATTTHDEGSTKQTREFADEYFDSWMRDAAPLFDNHLISQRISDRLPWFKYNEATITSSDDGKIHFLAGGGKHTFQNDEELDEWLKSQKVKLWEIDDSRDGSFYLIHRNSDTGDLAEYESYEALADDLNHVGHVWRLDDVVRGTRHIQLTDWATIINEIPLSDLVKFRDRLERVGPRSIKQRSEPTPTSPAQKWGASVFSYLAIWGGGLGIASSLVTPAAAQSGPSLLSPNPLADLSAVTGQPFSQLLRPYDFFDDADRNIIDLMLDGVPDGINVTQTWEQIATAPDAEFCSIAATDDSIFCPIGGLGNLLTYDWTDLADIQQVGSGPATVLANRLEVRGDAVYGSSSATSRGLGVWDVTNRTSPIEAQTVTTLDTSFSFAIGPNYVLLGDNSELRRFGFDPANPFNLTELSGNANNTRFVATIPPDLAFADLDLTGLGVLNVSTSSPITPLYVNPNFVSDLRSLGVREDAAGNVLVYLTRGITDPTLEIWNFTSPTNPSFVGNISLSAPVQFASRLPFSGNYVVVPNQNQPMIVDVRSPDAPVEFLLPPLPSVAGLATRFNRIVTSTPVGFFVFELQTTLSGTPTTPGPHTVTVTGNNGFGTAQFTFNVNVAADGSSETGSGAASGGSGTSPVGAAVGGAVGGTCALITIAGVVYVIHTRKKEKHDQFELEDVQALGGKYIVDLKVTDDMRREVFEQSGLYLKGNSPFIAEGQYGKVSLAKQLDTGRYVAMKDIEGKDAVKESLQEAERQKEAAGAGPGVLPVLNTVPSKSGTRARHFYELCPLNVWELQALLHFIKESRPDDHRKIITAFAKDVLEGLRAIHTSQTHRDLKPQNIMLRPNGEAAITDFGNAGKGPVINGKSQGDGRYFDPARFKARIGKDAHTEIDGRRSDTCAVGYILLEMLLDRTISDVLKLPNKKVDFVALPPDHVETQLRQVPFLVNGGGTSDWTPHPKGSLEWVIQGLLDMDRPLTVEAALKAACFKTVVKGAEKKRLFESLRPRPTFDSQSASAATPSESQAILEPIPPKHAPGQYREVEGQPPAEPAYQRPFASPSSASSAPDSQDSPGSAPLKPEMPLVPSQTTDFGFYNLRPQEADAFYRQVSARTADAAAVEQEFYETGPAVYN